MTVAFGSLQSKDVANGGASPNLTITKPSGLAEDDLMVAFLGTVESTNAYSASGWTQIQNISDGDFTGTIDGVFTCLAKIATSSDASASDFTFSQTGGDGGQGTLVRVTSSEDGFDLSSLLVSTSDFDEDGSPFTGSGITPANTNNFLLFALFQGSDSLGTSGYAIATDNPTWTERTERAQSGAVDTSQQLATASRPELTATGNYTATTPGSKAFGMLLAVNEVQDGAVTGVTGSLSLSGNVGSPAGSATITGVTGNIGTLSGNTGTAEATEKRWKPADKSGTPSWTPKNKS